MKTEIALNKKNTINTHIQKKKINGTNKIIMPSTNTATIQVKKRDGRKELLDIKSMHEK